MRVKLTVEYDGTKYAGWQRQKNAVSVQETLERAFFAATGEKVCVHGAGRTDAGVHARAQVAHLDTNCSIPAGRISFALNMHLPADIRVLNSQETAQDFHSRYCAKAKTYRYTIHNDFHAPAIMRHTAAHVRGDLDIGAMRKAAQAVIGTHDFAAFCAAGSGIESTVRTVHDIDIYQRRPLIYIDITGSGFLYRMVRIIAGTLIEIGLKKRPPECMAGIIAGRDRNAAGITAAAKGLTLMNVSYRPDADERGCSEK